MDAADRGDDLEGGLHGEELAALDDGLDLGLGRSPLGLAGQHLPLGVGSG